MTLELINKNKKKIAANYSNFLLKHAKNQIYSIILFGSVSKDQADEDSDIDIFVIHFDDDNFSKTIADITLDFMLLYKEQAPIEYITTGYFEYIFNPTYFMLHIIETGSVLYMADKIKAKKKATEALINLSNEFSSDAEKCYELNMLRAAVDLGYNSIELKIKAFLLTKLDKIPRSHGGLISKLGELFVLSNIIPKDIGRDLNRGLELRNKARYDPQRIIMKNEVTFILDLIKRIKDYESKII